MSKNQDTFYLILVAAVALVAIILLVSPDAFKEFVGRAVPEDCKDKEQALKDAEAALQQQGAVLQQRINDLQARIQSEQSKLSLYERNLENAADKEAWQIKIDAQRSFIQELQIQLLALQAQLAALQQAVADAKAKLEECIKTATTSTTQPGPTPPPPPQEPPPTKPEEKFTPYQICCEYKNSLFPDSTQYLMYKVTKPGPASCPKGGTPVAKTLCDEREKCCCAVSRKAGEPDVCSLVDSSQSCPLATTEVARSKCTIR